MKKILIKTTAICLTAAMVTSMNPVRVNAMPGTAITAETAIAGMPLLLGDYYNRNTTSDLEAVLASLKKDDEKKTYAVESSSAEKESVSKETETSHEADTQTFKIASDTEFVEKEVRENNYKSIYAKVAIAQVEKYVNVRKSPTTEDSDNIVGRIYNNCAAIIKEVVSGEDGDWFKVKSGDVEGYIKADLFVTGVQAKSMASEVGTITATAQTEALRVRESASLEAEVVTQLEKGSTYTVLEEEKDGFVKVEVVEGLEGYVYADCVKVDVEFQWAVSNQEQAEREEKLENLKFAEKEADAQYFACFDSGDYANAAVAAQDWADTLKDLSKNAARFYDEETASYAKERLATVKEYIEVANKKAQETPAVPETQPAAEAPVQSQNQTPAQTQPQPQPETQAPVQVPVNNNVSDIRQQIVSYAASWVGRCNYVYGGTNLVDGGGVDCSGFTLTVYSRIAGIGLSRCSYQQVNDGRRIGFDQLQPGDLVFYGDGGISHVAIYIGNGQIVHAKNPSSGIGIDSLNYKAPIAAVSILG